MARDITEQKLMEVERARVAERERAALRSAEEANRLKDDFLAMVSQRGPKSLEFDRRLGGFAVFGQIDA